MFPPLSTVTLDRIADDGRKVEIQVDLLRYVIEVLTPQLDDPQQPRCCHICFSVCCATLRRDDDDVILSYLLLHRHDFFEACIAALAAPRKYADLVTLKARLEDNRARCPRTEWHCFVLPLPVGDPLELFLTGLIACVTGGIRNAKPKGWFKAKERRGIWPTCLEQLIPYGALVSVTSYVSWCHTLLSPFAVPLLVLLLELGCPVVFPPLLASPQRDILMQTLLVMLHGPPDESAGDHGRPWPISMWKLPADYSDILRPQQAAVTLLNSVFHGQGTVPDDLDKLYAGYERPLYVALLSALDSNTIHHKRLLYTLCSITQQLHEQLLLPPSRAQAAVDERLIQQWDQWNVPEDIPTEAGLLYLIVQRHLDSKTCAGAGCRTYGKQACSRCRVVRYCGQACQRNDWRVPQAEEYDACVTHKAVCPILCTLRDAGAFLGDQSAAHSLHRFVDSYRRADIPHADYRLLVSWGVVSGMVPSSVLFGGAFW